MASTKIGTKKDLSKDKIIDIIKRHKSDIKKLGVKKIGLFGSFLKRTNTKKSDLDFLVTFNKPTFDNYMELKFMLEKLFKKKVDLIMEDNLKPALRYVKEEAIYAR